MLCFESFLHFDIFRLFGPVYDLDVMTVNLPYYKEFSLDKRPSCKPDEFMNCVIEDLHSSRLFTAGRSGAARRNGYGS